MPRSKTRRGLTVLAALALVACGDREPESAEVDYAEVGTDEAVAEASATAPQGSDRFEVTINGPPFDGTHRLEGDMDCMNMGGLWQAGNDGLAQEGISGMIMQMEGVPLGGGSTDQAALTVMFGQMEGSSGPSGLIDVRGAASGEDAQGTVTREGNGAVLRVEGTTHSGTGVTAVLHCENVFVVG